VIIIKKHYSSVNVGFIGMGYVGLVACAVIGKEHYTHYYDTNSDKMRLIKNKDLYINEPYLSETFKDNRMEAKGRTSIADLVKSCRIIFVTVGTPSNDDGSVDVSYVMDVAKAVGKGIAKVDESYNTTRYVILKSTVPPSTTKRFTSIIAEYAKGRSFDVLYSPEFLSEGTAIYDMENPDKIVIGTCNKRPIHNSVIEMFEKMYGGEKAFKKLLMHTTWGNAEMIKYANNAFLATKVNFINQIADICEVSHDTDVNIVAEALGKDLRINPKFLRAGLGFGGSCFTKDIKGIAHYAESRGVPVGSLRMVDMENHDRRNIPTEIASTLWGMDLKGKKIAILGLTFKPNTDDVRDAPAIDIIRYLLEAGADVQVYDPKAESRALSREFHNVGTRIVRCPSAKYALKNADMVVLVTEWDEFNILEADDFLLLMNTPVVVDGRRIIGSPEKLISKGIKYYGIGYGNNAINRQKIS